MTLMHSMAGTYSIADMQSMTDALLNHYLQVGHLHSVDDVLNCGEAVYDSHDTQWPVCTHCW